MSFSCAACQAFGPYERDKEGHAVISLRRLVVLMDGPDEFYRDRFDPQLYPHHDYTRLQVR
jgi:hypothetical protein